MVDKIKKVPSYIVIESTGVSGKNRVKLSKVGEYLKSSNNNNTWSCICSNLPTKGVGSSASWMAIESCGIDISGVLYVYYEETSGFTTTDEFLAWWEARDIQLYAILATPTEESLASDQLSALQALQTYYPQTNVSVTSEQIDGYMTLNYPISTGLTGDVSDTTVTFTEPTALEQPTTGEKLGGIIGKVSLAIKNIKALITLIGNTDIKSIGDGTVTGAISDVNGKLKNIYLGNSYETIFVTVNMSDIPDGIYLLFNSYTDGYSGWILNKTNQTIHCLDNKGVNSNSFINDGVLTLDCGTWYADIHGLKIG